MIYDGFDCTHDNLPRVPPTLSRGAGYTTGTPDIQWTAADWAAHPWAVRICQDAAASDHTADVLDIETGAATIAEAAGWYKDALVLYQAGARPGQRYPALYTSASNVTPLVNQLIADGVTSGPRLYVAHWGIGRDAAAAMLASSGGPFPVVAVQYQNEPDYDLDLWDQAWFDTRSATPAPAPAPAPARELVRLVVTATYSDGSTTVLAH